MNNSELTNITNSFKEKLGEENYALISDDIGILLTKNSEVLEELDKKDNEIKDLSSRNEKLVSANGSLLKQVSMGVDKEIVEVNETKKSFNFKDAFDEKGRFKEKM